MTDRRRLIDSNICVYLLEGASDALRKRVAGCYPGDLVTSSVVYAEVGMGVDHSDPIVSRAFQALFGRVSVLPFDEAAAEQYWTVPFRRGRFDRLIAAHALALGIPIVTANPRDLADVPGLKVENWTE